MRNLAIVFDGSGVVYGAIRSLKDIETEIVKHIKISGINIASELDKGAMAVLKMIPEEEIGVEEPSKFLSVLLKEKNIPITVIYKSDDTISDEEVKQTILLDENVTVKDIKDTISYLRKYDIPPEKWAIGTSLIVEVGKGIKYVLSSSGKIFSGYHETVDALQKKRVSVFLASGDRISGTEVAKKFFRLPSDNILGMMKPEDKRELVRKLKREYKQVIMVGDDKNDYLAMKEADIAVLSLQAEAERVKEIFDIADYTIKDIREAMEIVKKI